MSRGAELEGGADHGYSEAIYHHDLKGSGGEIYCDKPVSESDISDNRQITGVTEELDAHSLVDNLVNIPQVFKIPAQTKIAHVHLSVKDTLKSSKLQYFLDYFWSIPPSPSLQPVSGLVWV